MRLPQRWLAMALVLTTAVAACSTGTETGDISVPGGATAPPLIEKAIETSDPVTEDGTEPIETQDEDAVGARTTITTTTVTTSTGTEAGGSGAGASPAAEPAPIEIEIGVEESDLDELLEELDDTIAELLAGLNQSEGEIEE